MDLLQREHYEILAEIGRVSGNSLILRLLVEVALYRFASGEIEFAPPLLYSVSRFNLHTYVSHRYSSEVSASV